MFTKDERRLLVQAASRPDDDAPRQVLADLLLERAHPLGELLRLEAEERDLPRRRALEASLLEPLRAELVPWCRELELDAGLPAWALADPLSTRPGLTDEPAWSVRSLSLLGQFRDSLPLLRSAVARAVQVLDCSAMWATTQYTMWIDGAPPPLQLLPALVEWALPQGEIPAHWVPILAPGFSALRQLTVGVGPGFTLPDWALTFPKLERVRLVPGREPGDGDVVLRACDWAVRRPGKPLEWLGERLDVAGVQRALRPALPGAREPLPEERLASFELLPDHERSRIWRPASGAPTLLRGDDAPMQDLFGAPALKALVGPAGLFRIRRALFAELSDAGEEIPLATTSARQAVVWALELLDGLLGWWSTGAPDVLAGEWVGLGRDQLRRRSDGTLAIIPVLTRRMGPDAHALPDLAGVPLCWAETRGMVVRLTCAVLFEWLTGLSFLESRRGSAVAVHQRLSLRLSRVPRPSSVNPSLRAFDEVVREGVTGALTPDALRRGLEGALRDARRDEALGSTP
jgi:hypothetical protein